MIGPSPQAPAWGDTPMKASSKAQCGFVFISGSVYRRIPLFRHKTPCHIFLRALDAYRRKYRFLVHAYALMPDHYHILLWLPPRHRLVNFLRDFKSFVGRQILEWMHKEGLSQLLAGCELKRVPRRRKDARYCVLQYNNYVKELQGSQALWQKVNYIHFNPVQDDLVLTPEAYSYSSARAYAGKGLSPVKIDLLK